MSSLFTQINKISQEAQEQRSIAKQQLPEKQPPIEPSTPSEIVTVKSSAPAVSESIAPVNVTPKTNSQKNVTSASDVVTSQSDVTIVKTAKRPVSDSTSGNTLGKGSRIDIDKLKTIIEELSVLQTSAFGFSVRMSKQEQADIEEFVLGTLRKEGLRGYEVSTAKLMRYAMRYMFRVHPQEFIAALRTALEVEESLSI